MKLEHQQHLINIRAAHVRRLQLLELRVAKEGIQTPPSVLMEVEELQEKIGAIDVQLENVLETSPSPSLPLSISEKPPVPPSRFTRLLWPLLIGLGVVIIGIIIWRYDLINRSDQQTSVPSSTATLTLPTPTTTLVPISPTPTATEPADISIDIIGEDQTLFTDDEWVYRHTSSICGASCTQSVSTINGQFPSGKYIITLIIVGNRAASDRLLPPDFFRLIDGEGQQYQPLPTLARQYIRPGINADLMEEDTIPSFQRTKLDYSVLLIFDVPVDATNLVLYANENPTQGWQLTPIAR